MQHIVSVQGGRQLYDVEGWMKNAVLDRTKQTSLRLDIYDSRYGWRVMMPTLGTTLLGGLALTHKLAPKPETPRAHVSWLLIEGFMERAIVDGTLDQPVSSVWRRVCLGLGCATTALVMAGVWRFMKYYKFSARLTADEAKCLTDVTLYNGYVKTKEDIATSGVYRVCQQLWPSATLEHIALRYMIPGMWLKYARNDRQFWRLYNKLVPENKMPGKPPEGGDAIEEFRAWMASSGSNGEVPLAETTSAPTTEVLGSSNAVALNQPPGLERPQAALEVVHRRSPEDEEVIRTAEERMVINGDTVAIVGTEYGRNSDGQESGEIVGAVVGPIFRAPNVYANVGHNIDSAIQKRLVEKANPCTLDAKQKAKLTGFVNASMYSQNSEQAVFTAERVNKWITNHLSWQDIKSKKWSPQRMEASLENLYKRFDPKFSLKGAVKYEPMPEGKAPRLLIADGDDGQLMALLAISCFEDILFEHFEAKSIKHLAKDKAIDRVVKELRHVKRDSSVIEGDGSAWDTTCNAMIRALVENPVIERIGRLLIKAGIGPAEWIKEHEAINSKAKLKLFFTTRFEKMHVSIDAIRRSGHRGTSCLNWWMNFTIWVNAIFKDARPFLNIKTRKGEAVDGTKRYWNGCFEGDDSLCIICPPMKPNDELSTMFEQFWASAGFNMKLVYCEKTANFVGCRILIDERGCTDEWICDIQRAFDHFGVSASASARKAAKEADDATLRTIGASKSLAYAYQFAGKSLSLSEWFKRFAKSCTSQAFNDREMGMQTLAQEDVSSTQLEEMIEEKNVALPASVVDEIAYLNRLGYNVTESDMAVLRMWEPSYETKANFEHNRTMVPAAFL